MSNTKRSAKPNAYDDEQIEQLAVWTREHRASYISSGGTEGHIMDMRFLGGYRFEPMLLIRYVGRKSGKTMINSLGYTNYAGEIGIVASLGGADVHPQWYHNIKAGGPLAFQIATQAFNATWREPVGEELEDVWTYVIKQNPLFKTYREITTREIPVILMTAQDQIPVFTE